MSAAIDVCVIEDHQDFRNALMEDLNEVEDISCERGFSSAEGALSAFAKGYQPMVILLDLGLPKINGIVAIPQLLEMCPKAQILVLTVTDDKAKLFQALGAGAGGYLLKTSSVEEVQYAILEVFRGAAPLSPAMAKLALSAFTQFAPKESSTKLTPRELEILELLTEGLLRKEIADRLGVSFHTVGNHLRNIYGKLHVHNRSGAVSKALKDGLL